ncbi:MAG TPA: MFS transporter [Nitrososphaerales archaeon]|nr:MFS transporter [Nitrososphaerales archaeon]
MRIPNETWVVFALQTLNSLGWSATMPFLAVYLEVVRNTSLSIIGAMYLVTGFFILASQLIAGRLTDSLGPKRVMVIGYVSSLLSAIVLGQLIQADAPVAIILFLYSVFSFVRMVSQPASSAIIASQTRENITLGYSIITVGGNLGFAIGPAIGGVLAQEYDYSSVFLLSAATSAIVGVIALFGIRGGPLISTQRGMAVTQFSARRWLSWKRDRTLLLFLLLTMGSFLVVGYEITPLSLYVAGFLHFSNEQIGYLFATNGLVIVVLQLPLTKLTERTQRLITPLIFSSAFASLAFVVASSSTTFLEMEVAMGIITLAEILQSVPSQTVMAYFSKVGNRGTYQGYYLAFTNAGRSIASFVGPLSFSLLSFDPRLAWILIAFFSIFVGCGFFLLSPGLQRAYEIQSNKKVVG